jgi:hypothetical protein
MSTRLRPYTVRPWTGGVNDAVDPGVLPNTDLQVCDNVVFGASGSRLKRGPFEYFDQTELPAIIKRSSSGTTRTIVFAESVSIASPKNEKLVVGERITIAGTGTIGTNYGGTFAVATISTTTTSNDTVTYTATTSVTESLTATTVLTVTKPDPYIKTIDFWYYLVSANAKRKEIVTVQKVGSTAPFALKFYSHDTVGRRSEILALSTAVTFVDGDVTTGTDSITKTAHGFDNGYRVTLSTSGVLPAGLTAGTYYLIVVDANTLKLATTRDNARDGTAVDITAAAGGGTHTITLKSSDFSSSETTRINCLVINERLLFAFDGHGNVPREYDPNAAATYKLLPGLPPDATRFELHQGRVFATDKNARDLLHFSPTGDEGTWYGYGDSGGIPIFEGDGDPKGLVGLKSFKGDLFIGKDGALYRLLGTAPEEYYPELVSGGIGVAAPEAMASVDQDDVFYLSERGVHSIAATDSYGDFEGSFLSEKLQNTFNSWSQDRLHCTEAVYIPTLNSIAFTVAEDGQAEQNAIWFYNTKFQSWHRWPRVFAQSLAVKREADAKPRLMFGSDDSRVVLCQGTGDYSDFGDTPILYRVKSGSLYPGDDPLSYKGFKAITFFFKPKGNYSFTVNIKIDNLPTQAVTFQQGAVGAKLGEDFVLGSSVLSFDSVLAPYTQRIDGYGRGCTIEVTQTGLNEQVEIYGFTIWYEPAEAIQEVVGATGTT